MESESAKQSPITPNVNLHVINSIGSPSKLCTTTPASRKRTRKPNVGDDSCGRVGVNILHANAKDSEDVNGVRAKPTERTLKRRLCAVEAAEASSCDADDVNYFDPATSDELFGETIKFWKSNAKRARKRETEHKISRTSTNNQIEEFKSAPLMEENTSGPALSPFDDYPQEHFHPFPQMQMVQVQQSEQSPYIQYIPVPVPFMFHFPFHNR